MDEPITTRPTLKVNPHDIDMTFLSKTLFTIPAAAAGAHHAYRHPRPVLNATLIDSRHLLVTYTPSMSEEGRSVSSVHLVRLGVGKLGSATKSSRIRLSNASITGCVRDYYIGAVHSTSASPASDLRYPLCKDLTSAGRESASGSIADTAVALPTKPPAEASSHSVASSVLGLSGPLVSEETHDAPLFKKVGGPVHTSSSIHSGKKATESIDDKCKVQSSGVSGGCEEGTRDAEISKQSTMPTLHTFLFTDAATHSIWALEIDIGALTARVVYSSLYWEIRKKGRSNVEQKRDISPPARKTKALLGGKRGFVDGPFHVARFAFPSAMCWHVDQKSTVVSPTVLFVSDTGNHAIRYVDFQGRMVRTIAGIHGIPGYRDGEYRLARLNEATALSWCSVGLLFTDGPNGAIRLITHFQNDQSSAADPASAEISRGVPKGASTVPKVWTVAGGSTSKGDAVIYIDVRSSHRDTLGLPSALGFMPDGNGIVFADGLHHALRVLSDRGVETVAGPTARAGSITLPSGLLSCSNVTVCNIVRRDAETRAAEKRLAFIVASARERAVSLIIPCQESDNEKGTETGNKISHDEALLFNFFPSVSSLAAGYETWIPGGEQHSLPVPCLLELKLRTLQALPVSGTREVACQTPSPLKDCRHQKQCERNEGSNIRRTHSTEVALHSRFASSLFRSNEGSMNHELQEAERRLFFRVYTNYATHTGKCRGLTAVDSGRSAYSLSMLCFWRFVTHAEYYSSPMSLFVSSASQETPLFNESECKHCDPCSLHDKRAVVEALHRLSVRHRGYRVYSTMDFEFFSRVVVLLHRKQNHGDAVLGMPDDGEKIAAYNDAVCRISTADRNATEAAQFCASDMTMRLLMRNEESLRQLFEAFGKPVNSSAAASEAVSGGGKKHKSVISLVRKLRSKLCAIDPKHCGSSVEWFAAMPFDQFRSLFQTVDVFPTLISHSLLEQAFTDAVSTPLFHRLRQATLRSDTVAEQQTQKEDLHKGVSMLNDKQKAISCHSDVLFFITFIEAFTRVALTVFSRCGERDRAMYPTAASKVCALMQWINRSFALGAPQGRQDTQHSTRIGAKAIGAGSLHTRTTFPFNFKRFDVRAQRA